ncbi:hypothetical protein RIF29_40390 [Crotalaria pallida]|uniref:Cytochrome P450 n=1 Tax=Crotalaria pallida TaxID=3830 RepID=A0AAN9E3F6_CROPI
MDFSLASTLSCLLLSARFWYLVLGAVGLALLPKLFKLQATQKSKKMKLPPGPKPWPIVGNLPEMIANRPTFRWIQKLQKDLDTEIMCIRLGNIHVVSVTSPEIGREFFVKQDATVASRPANWTNEFSSGGYLTIALNVYGDQWKKMKRVITNDLFSPTRHQWLHDKRVEEADYIVKYVFNKSQREGGAGLVNLRLATQQYTGNVIRRLIFNKRFFGKGAEDGAAGVEELEHVDALFTVPKYLFAFSISDFVPFLREFDLDGHKRMTKKAIDTLKKYHDPIIEDRIQQWKNGERKDQEDLLDVLILLKDADGNPLLTLEEIKYQIMELMFATVDNPSNSFEWALAEMLNQPELLRKATEELDNVVGKGRQVQESDFSKLNFVKACAREAFRLHPIEDFAITHCAMDDTIVANYFIPKGSHVILRRQGVGHNPRIWKEDTLKFKPERHLNGDNYVALNEPSLDLVTFGTGRRGCPGVTLGTAMTLMLFARMLHGFTWSIPNNETCIDLTEHEENTTKAKHLLALAKPRLPFEVYGI